ncbi:MAG: tetratricopeptide repeat protein [Candidatus Marinimicrobia bacterium]|nr:tetratricopeptide repeat protein [Candidatus Neomarinimicrobiota bacterium]
MKIKSTIICLLCIPMVIFCQQNFLNGIFQEANDHYMNQQYVEAINLYNRVLQQGYEHVDLYYNLGNAYYRLGRLGDAIWAYEKGLKLHPKDADIRFNLKVSNARIVDRVEVPEGFFLIEWYGALKRGFSPRQWLLLISSLFLVSSVVFALSFLASPSLRSWIRKVSTIGLIFTILSFLIYIDLHFEVSDLNEAVIVTNDGKVYSSPTEIGKVLFIVHEGTKTKITQEQFPWLEIELIDGKKGWLRTDHLRRL